MMDRQTPSRFVRARLVGSAFLLIVCVTSCQPEIRHTARDRDRPFQTCSKANAEPTTVEILVRRDNEFERAVLYKPLEGVSGGPEVTFAPLIVHEVGEGESDPDPIGMILCGDEDRPPKPRFGTTRANVYWATSKFEIRGMEVEQVIYLWWYRCRRHTRPEHCDHGWGRGMRIVLGPDGFPLVWEALQQEELRRILYVSESLEAAARAEFGPPLPGRRFSIERTEEPVPPVLVVDMLPEGPVPMGPYVYLDAGGDREMTTVLCRCSPSQMETVVETPKYELVPLTRIPCVWENSAFDSAGSNCLDQARGGLGAQDRRRPFPSGGAFRGKFDDVDPLDELLRWPSSWMEVDIGPSRP